MVAAGCGFALRPVTLYTREITLAAAAFFLTICWRIPMKPMLHVFCLLLTVAAIGCGGSPELPATGGGANSASQEEIQKQIEASKSKAMGAYKGNMPMPGGKQ